MKETTIQKTTRKQQLIKVAVFAGLGVLFALSMWFIFKPSESEVQKDLIGLGLNDKVPQATTKGLPDDKSKAYEQAWQLEDSKEKKQQLNDLANYFEQQTQETKQEYKGHYNPGGNAINESVTRYQNADKELKNFYGTSSTYDEEKEQLKERLQELEEKLQEQKQQEDDKAEQLALMEKSYEMAAKYMPQTAATNKPKTTPKKTQAQLLKLPTVKVQKAQQTVVSALQQQEPDTVFIHQQMQERNRRFYSVEQQKQTDKVVKNTLKVCVHRTVLLRNGETVALRLLEKAQVGGLRIPKYTLLTARAQVQGNRLRLRVSSIAYKEQLLGVKLTAFELDCQEGVYIPGSDEMNALKEVAANMGSSAGQSFTFSSSAGQQIVADVGKGLLNGTSKLLNKKLKEIKVTLKAGHLLYLVEEK